MGSFSNCFHVNSTAYLVTSCIDLDHRCPQNVYYSFPNDVHGIVIIL
jgi:hypothetical protein